MKFQTTIRKESQKYPGVFYTLKKMSEGRRVALRLLIAEPTAEIRSILREMRHIEEQYPDFKERPEHATQQMFDLADRMDGITISKIDPFWLRWGLKELEGLEIDDQPADAELLISDGPPGLFEEIVEAIKVLAQLNGEEEKNSESPTTSGEQEGGTTKNTSAEAASNSDTTETATAESTSQS
jgi:signal recognition particle subunit SEC65